MKITSLIYRGNEIESKHSINAIAISEKKGILFSAGSKNYKTCFRSSFKPFQASTAVLLGATKAANFSKKEIALMCASHSGEQIHITTVKEMIKKSKLSIKNFQCGIHPPLYKPERKKILIKKGTYSIYHNNCSGKHAGMLALGKHLNTNLKTYLNLDHIVQKEIFKQLKKLSKKSFFPISTDGCSAPTPFVSILTIAKLFKELGSNNYEELKNIYNSMVENPYLIGGKDRFDTDFISSLKGRGVCKAGGEAVRGIVIKTKKYGIIGIGIKVLDGNHRALEPATIAILNYLNLLSNEEEKGLKKYKTPILFNHRKIQIGKIQTKIY